MSENERSFWECAIKYLIFIKKKSTNNMKSIIKETFQKDEADFMKKNSKVRTGSPYKNSLYLQKK